MIDLQGCISHRKLLSDASFGIRKFGQYLEPVLWKKANVWVRSGNSLQRLAHRDQKSYAVIAEYDGVDPDVSDE